MTEKKTKAEAAAKPGVFEQLTAMVTDAQAHIQIPSAARDFLKRNAETAKTRVAEAEKSAHEVAASVEKALVAVVGAGATASRGAIEATVANAQLALGGLQSIADAASPQEAAERYVAFVRAFGEANVARAQDGFAKFREAATDGGKALQAEFGKFTGFGKFA